MKTYSKASTLVQVQCITYIYTVFLVANCSSCKDSNSTVEYVETCPKSEEEFKTATRRKKCFTVEQSCVPRQEFLYHCVIDPYAKKLLEVCAPKKAITYGRCTEFSLRASRIQANRDNACTNFKENSCPKWYQSTEAYKYPGCYDLVTTSINNPSSSNNDKKESHSQMKIGRNPVNIGRPSQPAPFLVMALIVLQIIAK